jgi:hypothetical protein
MEDPMKKKGKAETHIVALGDGKYFCRGRVRGVAREKATWYTEEEAEGQAAYLRETGHPKAAAEPHVDRSGGTVAAAGVSTVAPAPAPVIPASTPSPAPAEVRDHVVRLDSGGYYCSTVVGQGVPVAQATRLSREGAQRVVDKLRPLAFGASVERL